MPRERSDQHHATSVDGRHFVLTAAVDALDVRVGSYLVIDHEGAGLLGYATSVALDPSDRRLAAIEGRVLTEASEPFAQAAARAATPGDVVRWLDVLRPSRAALEVGSLTYADGMPLALDAGAFDRHTFLCGQSGSGKTYALGTILERLLAETTLRVVVLDPNSDFVRLTDLRDDAGDDARARYAGVAASIDVRRANDDRDRRLHVRFRDFDAAERAAVLRLDPIADREEYGALLDAVERADDEGVTTVAATIEGLLKADGPYRSLALRARNLGVDRWQVWSGADSESLEELVQPGGPRCVVADLGSLETRGEQAVAAEAVLAALWRRRAAREPVLIVIDEAHNVCPALPDDPLTALATEHAVRIAGEGRKFGLVLLAATQRPQKVHENVVSQCDNLVLMRMNSRSDLATLSETFSFVPPSLLGVAAEFRQGEAVVAGKLVPSPTLGRFGPRWTLEGGSDVPSDWAAARS